MTFLFLLFFHHLLAEENEIPDPLEAPNRVIYFFNHLIDGLFLKPIAILYDQIMPESFKKTAKNIHNNLKEVTNVVFYLFQGDPDRSLKSAGRFILNTTIGLGGILDIAKHIDLSHEETDMNETFIKWGATPGFYLVIPFFGPSSLRGATSLTIETIGDPWYYITGNKHRGHNKHQQNRVPLYAIYAIDKIKNRAELLGVSENIESSVDPYAALRSYYSQHQQHLEEKVKQR